MTELLERLAESGIKNAARIAIAGETGTIRYRDLFARADAFAHALIEAGGSSGDRIAVISSNTIQVSIAYLGALKAGRTPVPINPALSPVEAAYILSHAEPAAIFAEKSRLELARAAEKESGHAIRSWFTDEESDGARSLAELEDAPRTIWPERAPEIALLMYTSGTTGRPKGVMISHASILAIARAACARFAFEESDVTACFLPLFHIYPFVVIFLESLLRGGKIAMAKTFGFPALLAMIAEHRVSTLMVVPPVVHLLASAPWDPVQYDLSSLKWIISGGAPLAVAPMEKLKARLNVPVFDGYGITETSSVVSVGPPSLRDRQGSAGLPLDGVSVRISDEGEIWVRSPGAMLGYYRDPEATARATSDGWFKSGDVGRLDEDGYLYVTDRLKDVIFVSGEKVYPREVEEAILTFPGVARAAVARMAHEATAEAPRAFIVPVPGKTIAIAELLAHLRDRLAPFKLPKKIDIVEALPMTASGKVKRHELEGS